MTKYIEVEKLKAEIDKLHDAPVPKHDQQCDFSDGYSWGLNDIENLIDSLQQEQPNNIIELGGRKYREVPAKTNDKICKDCDYFLDNGVCTLEECPCTGDNTILEKIQQEQPEVDLEKEIDNYFNTIQAWQIQEAPFTTMEKCARHFYKLRFNTRKEERNERSVAYKR